jgi:hypothetical protein
MPTPAQLREASRQARRTTAPEYNPNVTRRLASHAFALAQLAEVIERNRVARLTMAPKAAMFDIGQS